jgi:ketosteroid isomerase-like protein
MQMSTTHPDDVAGVKAWFAKLAEYVREVDFVGARPLFAPEMIAFGTFTDFMTGRDAAESRQWRNVWPHIDEFRWRADIRAIVSPDRLQAVGMGIFDSTGYRQDGTPYDRPGRATVLLGRERVGAGWQALHTHLSLFRDVPTQSYKHKPEKH